MLSSTKLLLAVMVALVALSYLQENEVSAAPAPVPDPDPCGDYYMAPKKPKKKEKKMKPKKKDKKEKLIKDFEKFMGM